MLPSKVTVSKTILIDAKDSIVTAQIEDYKNWKNWFPALRNKNLSVNQILRHDTVFAGLKTPDQNPLQIAFFRPRKGVIDISFPGIKSSKETLQFLIVSEGAEKTNLTLNVNTDLGWYPWKRLVGIFLDKITGPQYEAVIRNLKTACESHPN